MQRLYREFGGPGPAPRGPVGGRGSIGMASDADGDGLVLRAAELLCSRLCHDLISPVAALNNGLELLSDDDGSDAAEIAGLLVLSASQAAGRLMYYRAAYGLGGDQADGLTVAQAATLVEGAADRDKVTFRWPRAGDVVLGRFGTKLLLNAAMVGLEALPRGGRLSLALHDEPAKALIIEAEGVGAVLRSEVAEALDEKIDVETLTPRSVHGYFTAWLARRNGGALTVTQKPDAVRLTVVLSSAG